MAESGGLVAKVVKGSHLAHIDIELVGEGFKEFIPVVAIHSKVFEEPRLQRDLGLRRPALAADQPAHPVEMSLTTHPPRPLSAATG